MVASVVFGANGLAVYDSVSYQFDPQGNVAHLLNDNGYADGHCAYDAWGQLMAGTNSTPYGYKGQWGYYTDSETGLLLLTHRYLDPTTGRFLTRDPIGARATVNLYAYVNNRVLSDIDASGLLPKGKPSPPRWRPIPVPRNPVLRKVYKLLKWLCAVDCVVYAVAIGDAINQCLSEGRGDSFVCCVNRYLKQLPTFVGSGCVGCISTVVCQFTIPGASAICGWLAAFCYPLIGDVIDWACQGVFDPRPGGSAGGQGGCFGPAYHCYPTY